MRRDEREDMLITKPPSSRLAGELEGDERRHARRPSLLEGLRRRYRASTGRKERDAIAARVEAVFGAAEAERLMREIEEEEG